jgi:N-acetylglucosamine-6-phosphate deacetylase
MSGDLLIYAARVVMRDRVVDPGWVYASGGRITAVGDGAPPPGLLQATAVRRIDAGRQWLVPGFIDMHVHGGDGADVMDGTPAAIRRIARFHASHGTTGWLPTTLTAPPDAIERGLRAVRQVQEETPEGAAILGVHLEGPFISPNKVGAQNPQYVAAPTPEAVRRLVEAVPGLVRKITSFP